MAEPNSGIAVPGEEPGASAAPQIEEAVKEKARGLGWKPKTEWDKEPGDWVPAREFVARQSLFDKIRSQKDDLYHLKRENVEMKRDLQTIKQYVKQMSEVEYKRAVADLNSQKASAVAEADVKAVQRIDSEIDQLKETRKEVKEEPVVPQGPPPEFLEWKSKNEWYDTDSELKEFADEQGYAILAKDKTLAPTEVLKRIEGRVKKMFPEKFGKSAPKGPAAVEAGGVSQSIRATNTGKLRKADLDEVQRKAMDAFVKRGILTEEQYLDSLSKNR